MARELTYACLTPDLILTAKEATVQIPDKYISEILFQKLTEYQDDVLFIDGPTGQQMTGLEVRETAEKIALSLIDFGLKEGDVVFGFSLNSSLYACCLIACTFVGVVFDGCMPILPILDVKPCVRISGAKAILCCKRSLSLALQACQDNENVVTIILTDSQSVPKYGRKSSAKVVSVHDLLIRKPKAKDIRLPLTLSKPASQAVAVCLASSGTTGNPKGILKSHRNLVAMCVKADPRLRLRSDFGDRITISCHTPLPHISGIVSLITGVYEGNVLVFNDGFKLSTFLSSVQKYKINYSCLTPASVITLGKHPEEVSKFDVSSLQYVMTAGAALPQSVVSDFYSVMRIKRLWQVYSMTESGRVTTVDPDVKSTATVGRPHRNVQLKIVDRETRQALGPNEVGELLIKSPENAIGYYNKQSYAENFSADGWLKSGDAAFYDDDGLLYIVDRYKEMIIVDIYAVCPSELESILLSHESVAEAAVIGIPDELYGEIPKGFVVLKQGHKETSEDQLLSFVEDRVMDMKRIRGGICFMESLPKISMGKIDRRSLRQMKTENDKCP